MLIRIHPIDPQERLVKQVADVLRSGGVIIYPTDTEYGFGCDIFQPKAVERICRIKSIDPAKANLSFVCSDLSDLSQHAPVPVYQKPHSRTLHIYLACKPPGSQDPEK